MILLKTNDWINNGNKFKTNDGNNFLICGHKMFFFSFLHVIFSYVQYTI